MAHARRGYCGVTANAVGSGGDEALRSQGLVWREVDGETVLLDLDSSAYLNLNRAGTCLLKLLGEKQTVDDLSAALQQEVGVSFLSRRARTLTRSWPTWYVATCSRKRGPRPRPASAGFHS